MTEIEYHRERMLLELGKSLLKIGAIRFGSFKSHDGRFSPYYVDLRGVASFPDVMKLTLSCLKSKTDSGIEFSHICGVPVSGAIFGAVLANEIQKPFLYTIGGDANRMHGQIRPGARVLMLDDVSESGKYMEHAIQIIRANGGIVSDALVVIDRAEGAKEALAGRGVTLHSFTTINELATKLKESMALTDEQAEMMETKPAA